MRLKRFITPLAYALLFVFLILGVFASARDADPILLIICLFFFVTGVNAISANEQFGREIKKGKKLLKDIEEMRL